MEAEPARQFEMDPASEQALTPAPRAPLTSELQPVGTE
jgi:hypothetical protein